MRSHRAHLVKGEAIVAKGLVKQYGERTVVDGLDLEVWPGEIVGLLGPNGAGKTTTFNMIVGAIRPTHGSVFLGEREITSLPMFRRARLGVVRQPIADRRIQDRTDGRAGVVDEAAPFHGKIPFGVGRNGTATTSDSRSLLASVISFEEAIDDNGLRAPADVNGAATFATEVAKNVALARLRGPRPRRN